MGSTALSKAATAPGSHEQGQKGSALAFSPQASLRAVRMSHGILSVGLCWLNSLNSVISLGISCFSAAPNNTSVRIGKAMALPRSLQEQFSSPLTDPRHQMRGTVYRESKSKAFIENWP